MKSQPSSSTKTREAVMKKILAIATVATTLATGAFACGCDGQGRGQPSLFYSTMNQAEVPYMEDFYWSVLEVRSNPEEPGGCLVVVDLVDETHVGAETLDNTIEWQLFIPSGMGGQWVDMEAFQASIGSDCRSTPHLSS